MLFYFFPFSSFSCFFEGLNETQKKTLKLPKLEEKRMELINVIGYIVISLSYINWIMNIIVGIDFIINDKVYYFTAFITLLIVYYAISQLFLYYFVFKVNKTISDKKTKLYMSMLLFSSGNSG